jgi:hypothetical protein
MAPDGSLNNSEELLLRRLHASCLLAPLAVWYPDAPTARAPGAAAQPAATGGSNPLIGSSDEPGPFHDELQHIRQAAAQLLGEQRSDQGTDLRQIGSSAADDRSPSERQQCIHAAQLLHGAVSTPSEASSSQQVSSPLRHPVSPT